MAKKRVADKKRDEFLEKFEAAKHTGRFVKFKETTEKQKRKKK